MRKSWVVAVFLAVIIVSGIGFSVWRSRRPSSVPVPAAPSTPAPQKQATPAASPTPNSAADAKASSPAAPAEVPTPFVPQKGNIVASDLGGVVERITSEYGPGYIGNRLIDGRTEPTWKPSGAVTFPQEIVFSFFNRQPALISSVVITAANKTSSPKDVEIWTSELSPSDGFKRVASQTLSTTAGDQVISFEPIETRYLKLRILSSFQEGTLEVSEVQVIEAERSGYMPLAARNPEMVAWKSSPRRTAQLGIEWLQAASMDWQRQHNCYGCHAQSQVIMGLSISRKSKYVVDDNCLKELATFVEKSQNPDGTYFNQFPLTATQFAAMGLSAFDEATATKSTVFIKSVAWLLSKQHPSGEIPVDHFEPPIDQGSLMTTSNATASFIQAYKETGKSRYKQAAERALTWIASANPETTQDKAFKVIALSRFGNSQQKQVALRVVAQLKTEQKADGGWQEKSDMKGSNAFATGQVLYAFKQAGVSIDSPEFSKGVLFLLGNQKETGAWPSTNSQSGRPSEFAPTMWAVIGLAGSFREAKSTHVVQEAGRIRITMDNTVLFDFDRSNLKPEAEGILAEIKSSIIDHHPGARLIVEGHTDDVGTQAYNLTLSLKRAQSVSDWMTQHGIEASRLTANGYGKEKPRYPNTNEENRARNRRVEISVLTPASR